ncbi:MAG: polysaccharide export protein [Phycisphaerales bacterium]|nr:MAG: polysaccharide export protein [Phycisphaerales bacterium]
MMRWFLSIIYALSVVASASLWGCASARHNHVMPAPPPDAAETDSPYLLAPGDRIEVKFPYKSDLNESLVIRPDGFVSLQLIGEVRAGGLTPAALGRAINEAYQEWIRNPHAAVIVREFAAQRVYVGGEVRNPGSIELTGPLTCLQAVFSRGGADSTANVQQVLLIRQLEGDAASVYALDLRDVMHGEVADVYLRPYDVVYVPRTVIAEIGEFVEQYINKLVPSALHFPYDLNTRVRITNSDTNTTR